MFICNMTSYGTQQLLNSIIIFNKAVQEYGLQSQPNTTKEVDDGDQIAMDTTKKKAGQKQGAG